MHITDTSPKDEQEDEHVVLFTGYDKREIAQLGIDARNCAVLDMPVAAQYVERHGWRIISTR